MAGLVPLKVVIALVAISAEITRGKGLGYAGAKNQNAKLMKFEIYKDKKGEWRWTLKARNGKKIADSAEGYKQRGKCMRPILRIKAVFNYFDVPIYEV